MEPSVCISDEADFEIQNSALPDYGQYTTVYPNAPIYATKATPPSSNQVATAAVNRMGSQCSYRTEHSATSKIIGSQSNLTSSVQELNNAVGIGVSGAGGDQQATMMPTLRYIQPTHYEEMSEYGINTVMPFGNDGGGSQYAEDSPVAYGYVSEANYVLPALGGGVGVGVGVGVGGGNKMNVPNATYATRPTMYDDGRNNAEAASAIGLPPQAFEDPHDFQNKMSQLTISSFGVVSQHMRNGGKDEMTVDGSCSDICSTMRWRDPNLSEVITFLNNPNNAIKANAAAYLQHLCYMDDPIKQRTRILGGIPPLIRLLSYEAPEIYK